MSKKRHTPDDEPFFVVRSASGQFAHGAALPAHSHPWGQLIFAGAGVMTVWTAQGTWVAPPHWAVWAPPGVAHAMRFTGESALRTLYLRPDVFDALPARCAVIAVAPLLRELILRAVEIGMLDRREPVHAAMAVLIADAVRAEPTPSLDLPKPRSAVLRRVADHLAAAPANRARHSALARRFGVGVRTLERGFLAETGLSLGHWRRQVRMLHALRQLGAGLPVKVVASGAGYRSASAFVAAFRGALETTPGRYFATVDAAGVQNAEGIRSARARRG